MFYEIRKRNSHDKRTTINKRTEHKQIQKSTNHTNQRHKTKAKKNLIIYQFTEPAVHQQPRRQRRVAVPVVRAPAAEGRLPVRGDARAHRVVAYDLNCDLNPDAARALGPRNRLCMASWRKCPLSKLILYNRCSIYLTAEKKTGQRAQSMCTLRA